MQNWKSNRLDFHDLALARPVELAEYEEVMDHTAIMADLACLACSSSITTSQSSSLREMAVSPRCRTRNCGLD